MYEIVIPVVRYKYVDKVYINVYSGTQYDSRVSGNEKSWRMLFRNETFRTFAPPSLAWRSFLPLLTWETHHGISQCLISFGLSVTKMSFRPQAKVGGWCNGVCFFALF